MNHVDEKNLPTMVDVSEKDISVRVATAQTLVQLPPELKKYFTDRELHLKKGPVFQTAIIAGTMAVKKTFELIPFCHQIPIESCKIKITTDKDLLVTIRCEVKSTFKTGVEMEALHGSLMTALTIYDMCKAVSHEIIIRETKLLSKTGGKRTVLEPPLFGLILTGGKSERMKTDKALLSYKGKPHAKYIYDILKNYCSEVFLSARKGQWNGTALSTLPTIDDEIENQGPISGILAAFDKHPHAHWIIVACDLAHFNDDTVKTLLAHYDKNTIATCFSNKEEGFPEPLCSLYTPKAKEVFENAFQKGVRCPVKVLRNANCKVISQEGSINLANINTQDEFTEAQSEIR
jgi:cyclic pyranopterin phosphate synthase